MRSIIFLLLTFFITIPALAQTPNKQQMQGQMKEVVNELNKKIAELEKQITEAKIKEENAESIRQKEEQLAMLKKQVTMMGGLNKNISSFSDKTFKEAAIQKENKDGIPIRDSKRINMLPDGILTNAELVVFVKKIHSEAERIVTPKTKSEALKIYNAVKAERRSSDYICNIANSLWMIGCVDLAVCILGKDCNDEISNTNNLNNYAAFLTMTGGEHAALPILQYLNNKFPNNSTVLNNIGQAWFGLGDMNNAKRFLDSAIKLYPRHSQANITKSKIQQAEGNTQEAIKSVKKAIQENYTPEKEARLVKLGGKLEYGDVPFRYKMKSEPLGIEKFILTIPEYIMDGGMPAANNEMEWNDFRRKLEPVLNNINGQIKILQPKADAYTARLFANPMILMPYNNSIYKTAKRKMDLLIEWVTYQGLRLDKKMKEAKDSVAKWRQEYDAAVGAHKEYNNSRGIYPHDCGVLKSLATAFNTKANTMWQQRNSELLSINKQFINTYSNLSLYAATDKSQYDLWIATVKIQFISLLYDLHHENEIGCMPSTPEEQYGKTLPDFDSLTCQDKHEIFIPPFTIMKFECNKMSTEFNVDTEFGLKFKLAFEEDLNNLNKKGVAWYNPFQTITKGTLEVAYEKSLNEGLTADGLIDMQRLGGPFKGELKAQGAIGIEFTGDRLTEAYIKGAISGELTGYIPTEESLPGYVEANKDFMDSKGSGIFNVEMKSSWNAGSRDTESSFSTGLSGQGLSSGGIFKSMNWATPQIKSN